MCVCVCVCVCVVESKLLQYLGKVKYNASASAGVMNVRNHTELWGQQFVSPAIPAGDPVA